MSPPPCANLAVVLKGGIDNTFGSWGETLSLLLNRGTPTAFTGYSLFDKLGCERLLVMMGAVVNVPTLSNPFRFNLGTSSSDAFIVGITGAGKPCSNFT
mmetsp:Transcript_124725/g.249062  ORF Transcript_124725/g.249062 Transcript_124725/m.249062 type:complete len:99 (+) Transcript_124725:1097-1393(+)